LRTILLNARKGRKPTGGHLAEGSVLVRGEGIYRQTGGTPEAGSHTVIFLHGAGGGTSWWYDQMVSVCDSVYAVSVDLPGHGKSQGRGFPYVEEYADWLEAFLDTLALRQSVVLVGSCLGGLVALEFAATRPERVQGLVLCGLPGANAAGPEWLRRAEKGDDLTDYVPTLFAPSVDAALRNKAIRQWLKTRPEVRLGDLRACSQYHAEAAIRALQAPAMVAAGREDRYLSEEVVETFVEQTGATLCWVEAAGTLCMLENVEVFRTGLASFLRDLTAPELPDDLRYVVGGYRKPASRY
jgi:pimeloyl-ACP methyl ester carboxylesterase